MEKKNFETLDSLVAFAFSRISVFPYTNIH